MKRCMSTSKISLLRTLKPWQNGRFSISGGNNCSKSGKTLASIQWLIRLSASTVSFEEQNPCHCTYDHNFCLPCVSILICFDLYEGQLLWCFGESCHQMFERLFRNWYRMVKTPVFAFSKNEFFFKSQASCSLGALIPSLLCGKLILGLVEILPEKAKT